MNIVNLSVVRRRAESIEDVILQTVERRKQFVIVVKEMIAECHCGCSMNMGEVE